MATIKGTDLRIFIDNKAVAASTSATLHIAASIQSTPTQDDGSELWDNSEVTGKSWDASTDALVVLGVGNVYTAYQDGTITSGNNTFAKYVISVPAGEKALIESDSPLYHYDNNQMTALAASTESGYYYYRNGLTSEVNAIICLPEERSTGKLEYVFGTANNLADLYTKMANNEEVGFEMAVSSGKNNRTVGTSIVSGAALITDLSVSAQAKNTSTFSMSLQGIGEIYTD